MAFVTVLFVTLNGAHTLPRMLGTLGALASPSDGWKVVAVDNGSTDDSLNILEQHTRKIPMMVVKEPRRGKNIALNTGLALVEGDIIAFTDDDIILPRDWLVSIENVAAARAEYDIFGGAIYPVWEEPPPAWVFECVPKYFLGWTDFSEGPVKGHAIWGGGTWQCALLCSASINLPKAWKWGRKQSSSCVPKRAAIGAGTSMRHRSATLSGHTNSRLNGTRSALTSMDVGGR
jgi:glycosyltransferase involved in cell wall biosynthesis